MDFMSLQTPGLPTLHSAQRPHNQDTLQGKLNQARQRIRALMALRFGSLALLITSLIGMLLVGLSKANLLSTPSPVALVSLIAAGVLVGMAFAFWPRLTDLDVAKLTERRADLKERLSSAVEFRQQGVDTTASFYGEQWTDASHHAAQVDISSVYPVHLPRTLTIGALLSLALLLIYFLPTLPVFWSPQQKKDAEDVKVTAITLQKVAEDKEKAADTQKLDEVKKAAQDTKALANKMKMGKMDKKESLVALQKLTQKFEQQEKKLEEGLPKKSMEDAAKQFKKAMDQMQKDVEHAQQKAAQTNASKDQPKTGQKAQDKAAEAAQQKQSESMKQMMQAMQQMRQAMQMNDAAKMQQSMQNMAQQMQQNGSQMSPQQMQQMQQALQQLSQSLQNTQMQQMASQMAQMAQQMQQQMNQMTPQQMQQLADAMKKMAGMCKNPGNGMPTAMMDAKALQELLQALKDGKMTMCMGTKPGTRPGFGGKGPGNGIGGSGNPTSPMKDPLFTKPHLLLTNQSERSKAVGKMGDPKKFAEYLAMSSKPSKSLPNAVVNGDRSQQGDELQINMMGDPDPAHSSSPYFKAYETSKKQAESTLNKESVPAAYKKQVKDYFDSIHP